MDDFKDIGRDLWKNKPLLITLVIAVVAVAYILIRNSQNQLSAASTADSTMPAGATVPTSGGATYVEESYSNYAPTTTTTTGTTTNPITTVTTAAKNALLTIRQASTADLAKKVGGIPVRAQPGTGASVGGLSFGKSIQATGAAIVGGYNNPLSGGSGSNLWYPVVINGKTGYVSAYDVGSAS